MEQKAQGALEYLLLLGSAVLIAAVVVVVLTQLTDLTKGKAQNPSQTH
ncbi:MAG: class III signal peptide-containing protein [Candidatus Diapherotrites archaeon]